MNMTLFILCVALVLYVGTCVYQWRKITKTEKEEAARKVRE